MARRRVARDRHGRPIGSKRRQRTEQQGRGGKRRRGFAGQDTINVNCPPGQAAEGGGEKKSKFPWGTVFVTGIVTALGSIVAYRAYSHFSGKNAGEGGGAREANPSENKQRMLNARDMLLLTSPGALENMPNHPLLQQSNPGPTEREMHMMEREAALREKVAELEGFIMAQQAAAQAQQSQRTDMQMLLEAMDEEDA